MDKVVFRCSECNKSFTIKFNEVAELPHHKCPRCKNENLFIMEFIFEEEPDRTPLHLGDRSCGTPGRFK